jgi:UDP-GlcNAc:undecaprenyl-phosphate/decaprenyl-phosphate GlcNAc-1-phosphate transferase
MDTALTFGIAALALCYGLHEAARALFPKWGLLDKPERYQLSRAPLPYPTGIISILTFVSLFVFFRSELSFQDQGLLICIALLAVTTLVDDRKGLPSWQRLLMQIGIGCILFATGTRIYTITNPLGGIIPLDTVDVFLPSLFSIHFPLFTIIGPLPLYSGIFTIIWIVITTNAFNWFDGIPGQVSILSVIGALTIGFLSLSDRVNQPEIAVIAFILAGCALGSAIFDFPFTQSMSKGPKAIMGDTGAMFFGLMLGTLTIYAGGKVATAFLVLGVPLIDAVLVTLRRILKKASPFKGSDDHLHHRLLKKGWNERQVILLTVILGSAFGITALFLSTFQKFIAIIILVIVMIGLTRYSHNSDRIDT